MIKVIRGDSHFSSERLERKITETENTISEAKKNIEKLTKELNDTQAVIDRLLEQYSEMIEWHEIYKSSSLEAKKMIVSQLIESVHVGANYKIEIKFRISYAQFTANSLVAYSA